MLRRVVRKLARILAKATERVSAAIYQVSLLIDLGPRRYAVRRKSLQQWRAVEGATFPNGISTALSSSRSRGWYRVESRPLVIALFGEGDARLTRWLAEAHRELGAHFLLSDRLVSSAESVPESAQTRIPSTPSGTIDLVFVLGIMHRRHRKWDLVLIDADQPLPAGDDIVRLQHAAHEYDHDKEVGFVSPAYAAAGGVVAGYQFDRSLGQIIPSPANVRDYGQQCIPRYVLAAAAHGFYATSSAIDRVDVPGRHLGGLDLNGQVSQLVRQGWAGNVRTLCFSDVVFDVDEIPALELSGERRQWLLERFATGDGDRISVIFVLTATSISGGIRAVFEIANGLSDRGMDVEIWSLQQAPEWFDLHVPVRTFDSYGDLLRSLRNADAIKVATWWETAEIVWLGSVNHGIPVYMIQEFETWFFPDDAVVQAAVAASYRHEFVGITEASYQVGELAEIGVAATMIPHGYDSQVFRQLDGWQRDDDTVLAVGRSFFQKNFAMTARAWRSLGERRPKLLLFGTEPDILVDERVEYRVRPRDPEVNELYNTATIFVQTSKHEGFCLPVLEAMAAGCPVITTDSHGNRDFCRDGENCIIVPQDDSDALAAAIERLLADPVERERLREAGLATAAVYGWPTVLNRVSDFYNRVAIAGARGETFAIESRDEIT